MLVLLPSRLPLLNPFTVLQCLCNPSHSGSHPLSSQNSSGYSHTDFCSGSGEGGLQGQGLLLSADVKEEMNMNICGRIPTSALFFHNTTKSCGGGNSQNCQWATGADLSMFPGQDFPCSWKQIGVQHSSNTETKCASILKAHPCTGKAFWSVE